MKYDESLDIDPFNEFTALENKKMRRRLVSIILQILFSALIFITNNFLRDYSPFYDKNAYLLLNALSALIIIFSITYASWIYLQYGFSKTSIDSITSSKLLKDEINRLDDSIYNIKISLIEINDTINKIKITNDDNKTSKLLSDEEKLQVINQISEQITNNSSEIIHKALVDKFENEYKANASQKLIYHIFSTIIERLSSETTKLTRRANLNLSIGSLTTILGLLLFGYFVQKSYFETTSFTSIQSTITLDSATHFSLFLISFTPRLSLVILIEVFAYFFLKLYKSTLAEIKYFQNEITNIQSKYIAMASSLSLTDNKAILAGTISSLYNTERNHILEKGQSTVELEKSKIETEELKTLIKSLSDTIKK